MSEQGGSPEEPEMNVICSGGFKLPPMILTFEEVPNDEQPADL